MTNKQYVNDLLFEIQKINDTKSKLRKLGTPEAIFAYAELNVVVEQLKTLAEHWTIMYGETTGLP
jgi:hypothetical protein